jgi:glyoxylase-like metal-dependent hydrolase (beta-lactamase superfamily II)
LKEVIEENDIKLSQIIITHWHSDHFGGTNDILKALKLNDSGIDYDFI